MPKRINIILVVSNIVFLFLLLLLLYRSGYLRNIARSLNFGYEKPYEDFRQNPDYQQQTDLYPFYQKKGTVVMLGNSITKRVNWNELLGRNDVINRGVGGDITEGFLHRLESVLEVKPEVCFIMGGVNDLMMGIPPREIVANLDHITSELKKNDIEPVVQSILLSSEQFAGHEKFNEAVRRTNTMIEEWSREEGITFLDLNQWFSEGQQLKAEYTVDGIHLSGKGYQKWAELLSPVIREKLLQTDQDS